MINFKPIEILDKAWIDPYLKAADYRGCDYSFGNLYIWRKTAKTMAAEVHNTVCVMSTGLYDNSNVYLYPAGKQNIKEAVKELLEDSAERGKPFIMRAVTKENAKLLEEWFPNLFCMEMMRDECDYLYDIKKMSSLEGKKYHGKRNHIKRFQDAGEWHYEDLSDLNIKDCIIMNDAWCKQNGCEKSEDMKAEQCAVAAAIKQYKELGFVGGILYQNQKVAAFTIGEALNSDTFVVHIEKAYQDIQGAYPMINQQFVLRQMQNYLYVNREDDLGKEGLRKAKLSYNPEILLEKYTVSLKQPNSVSVRIGA